MCTFIYARTGIEEFWFMAVMTRSISQPFAGVGLGWGHQAMLARVASSRALFPVISTTKSMLIWLNCAGGFTLVPKEYKEGPKNGTMEQLVARKGQAFWGGPLLGARVKP